ncbi:MAG: DNA-binding protein [Clostridia bacterium]|nr:DNA-binding protein [Clostridia bacterium]
MDYKKLGDTYYLRFDKGEEIVSGIRTICQKEHITSATYSGIGGCSDAEIQTFIPEKGAFVSDKMEGMLELVSLMGNIVANDSGELKTHTHAIFAYLENGEHRTIAGHLKATTVLYTGEIELRPVQGGDIHLKPSVETGTDFWDFR